jgi:hypothetical protein
MNKDLKIVGITSNFVNILNLDVKKLAKMNAWGYTISKVAPTLMDQDLQHPKMVEWNIPDFEKIEYEQ